MINDLREMLVRHEGLRLKMYTDSVGVSTIGVGHALTQPISRNAAMQILEDDLVIAITDCKNAFAWLGTIDSVRQDVLYDMAFNLGIDRLKCFVHFLAAMKAGDWKTAAREMLDSKWAAQVGHRANELAGMILTGAY